MDNKILLVGSYGGDSGDEIEVLRDGDDYTVESYSSMDEAREALDSGGYDAILYADGYDNNAEEFLSEVRNEYDSLPFLMLDSGSGSISAESTEDVVDRIVNRSYQGSSNGDLDHILPGISNSPVGVTIAQTANEDGDRPMIYINQAFEEMTGYSEAEVLGRDCRILQGDDTDPETVEEIRRSLENQETVETTILNYDKEGEEFWNRLRISPITNEEGEAELFFGYQVDVTDEVNYRENLELILSIVSHDFRNDLNVIRSHLDILKADNEDLGKETEIMERRIDSMVDSLQDISTVKDQMKSPENNEIVLNKKIESVVDGYMKEADVNGFEFDLENPDEDYVVESSVFLDQYFGNIFENSIEHSGGDRIEVGYQATEDEVTVKVADNGRGMDLDPEKWGTGMFLVNAIADQSGIDLDMDIDDGVIYHSTFERRS